MANMEEAKKQTIGVEIEMNNITRRDAAKVAAEGLLKGLKGLKSKPFSHFLSEYQQK